MTDLWFRNPDRAMSVLPQEGVTKITWTRQHIMRLKIDGIAYVRQFYMHSSIRPKIMIVGIQGCPEYHLFSKLEEPLAVYPAWSGKKDSWEDLLDLIENPWGEDEKRCSDESIPSALRPVYGQKHRVVITNGPPPISGVAQKFWLQVSKVQEDYPEVELFINGTNSFAVNFGLKFKACDYGLSDAGDINQHFILANGQMIKLREKRGMEQLYRYEDWVKAMGFTVDEILEDQHKRFALRIRSAKWAAKNWERNYRFFKKSANIAPEQIDESDDDFVPRESRAIVLRPKKYTTRDADRFLCNRCTISPGCKFYRADSICGLKDSEVKDLQKYFDSRNAHRIVEGLAELLKVQTQRLSDAIEREEERGELDPRISKEINAVFANGVKLAKLVDPNLAPGAQVNVNVGVNNSAQVVSMSNPKELIAGIVSALEAQGIPREQITPDMIRGALRGMATGDQRAAIEAQVISAEEVLKQEILEGQVKEIAAE